MPKIISRAEIGPNGPFLNFYIVRDNQEEPDTSSMQIGLATGETLTSAPTHDGPRLDYTSFFRWTMEPLQDQEVESLEEEFFNREGL